MRWVMYWDWRLGFVYQENTDLANLDNNWPLAQMGVFILMTTVYVYKLISDKKKKIIERQRDRERNFLTGFGILNIWVGPTFTPGDFDKSARWRSLFFPFLFSQVEANRGGCWVSQKGDSKAQPQLPHSYTTCQNCRLSKTLNSY